MILYRLLTILIALVIWNPTSTVYATENSCQEVEADHTIEGEEAEAADTAIDAMAEVYAQCRNENGSFKTETITLQDGDDKEEINCQDLAEEAYKISLSANCDIDRKGLMSCLTAGWDQRDQFDMFYRLAENPELDMKIEEHFNCPGKSEDPGALTKAVACSLMSSVFSSGPVASIGANAIINNFVPEAQRAEARSCVNSDNSCLSQAIWGVVQNVISNIQGLWELGKMAVKGIGRLFGFGQAEDASADQHGLLAQFGADVKNDDVGLWQASKNLIGGFLDGMWKAIKDGTRNQFSCVKWEGGVGGTRVGAKCLEAAPSFECATSQQKINMACGVIGFAAGEIVTAFLTGGTVRGASLVGKGLSKLSKAAGVGARVSRIPGIGMARTMMAGIGKSKTMAWVTSTSSKVGEKARLMFQVGDRMIPVGTGSQNKILSFAGKAAKAPLNGAKWYFKKMDEAYALGRHGKSGAFALGQHGSAGAKAYEAAHTSSNLQRKVLLRDEAAFRSLGDGQILYKNLEATQKALVDAQKAYREAVTKARRGVAGAQDEMDEAFKQYQAAQQALKNADAAYAGTLKVHQENIAAQKLAEKLAKEQQEQAAKAQAAAAAQAQQTTTSTSTALVVKSETIPVKASTTQARASDNVASASSQSRIANKSQAPLLLEDTRRVFDDGIGNISYTTQQKIDNLSGLTGPSLLDNRRFSIYRNKQDTWTENVFNPRVEGDKLIGNLGKADGEIVEIAIEDIALVDMRGSFKGADNSEKMFSASFSLSRSGDPKYTQWMDRASTSTKAKSNAEINDILNEMTTMTQAERSRIASVAAFKASTGQIPSELEFLAAIKNSGGYRTKVGLPNLDRIREIYHTQNTNEAMKMIDDLYGSFNSPATLQIRHNMESYIQSMGRARETAQVPVPPALIEGPPSALLDGPVQQNLLEAKPAPLLLGVSDNASGNLPVPSTGARNVPALKAANDSFFPMPSPRRSSGQISNAGSRVIAGSGAALIAGALKGSNENPIELDEVIIIGSRNNTNNNYELTASPSKGPPKVCTAYVKKRVNGELGEALTTAERATEEVVVKWFKTSEEKVEDLVCDNLDECTFPDGASGIYLVAYKAGEKFQSLNCTLEEEPVKEEPVKEEPFDPYAEVDREKEEEEDDGIDRAEEFYEQQRSPPPSLFQPIRIPSESTNYLHGGYY